MPRFDSGYVKLHRKILFGSLRHDGHAREILNTIVLLANLKPGSAALKRQAHVLQRGQLATSLDELVRETSFSKTIVHKRLAKLEKCGTISQKVTGYGRIITINNFDKYQSINTGSDTDIDTEGDTESSTEPRTESSTHSEEVRSKKKEYIRKPKASKAEHQRTLTWDHQDPVSKVLSNLSTCSGYRDIFDAPKDKETVEALMLRHVIPLEEMIGVTADLAIWAISPPRPVKNWRSTLNTFCKIHTDRRAEKQAKAAPKPVSLFATYGLNPDGSQQ